MSDFKETIAAHLSSAARAEATQRGLELLRIDVRGTQHNPVIQVIVDGAKLVSIDDCEVISHALHALIEADQEIAEGFRLDVMSPGIEEPMMHDWQFEKNRNRLVEVHYRDSGATHTLHGRLHDFSAETITLEPVIHGTSHKKPKTKVLADDLSGSTVTILPDEQVYAPTVELVVIPRNEIERALALPDFG